MILPFLGALCLLGAVYFLLPLGIGVCHIGMFWPAAVLLILATLCFFPKLWTRFPRWFKATAITVFALGLATALTILVLMSVAAADRPVAGEDAPDTVILLGCRVYDGKPSLMLQIASMPPTITSPPSRKRWSSPQAVSTAKPSPSPRAGVPQGS